MSFSSNIQTVCNLCHLYYNASKRVVDGPNYYFLRRMHAPLNIAIAGATGHVGYSLIYMISSGSAFGKNQCLNLRLYDDDQYSSVLEGMVMELNDCALSLVNAAEGKHYKNVITSQVLRQQGQSFASLICTEVVLCTTLDDVFKDCDVAFLAGGMRRKEGMLRKDLLKANAHIFSEQGAALNRVAKKTVKVVIDGNPTNTNTLICIQNAPDIPRENFTCVSRLDQNRAVWQIAEKLEVVPEEIKNTIIWGNHSRTMYADASYGSYKNEALNKAVNNDAWLRSDFLKTIQWRGDQIIKSKGTPSSTSSAKAICDHVHDWWFGTKEGEFVSMGVYSDGLHYGVPEGIIFSFPVVISDGQWHIVEDLKITDFAQAKIELTTEELLFEKKLALAL